jgi:putative PIN family toxin of toxin-antitoxin system
MVTMATAVVVDTDVFVSALLGAGAANRLIAGCLGGQFQPLMGAALYAEYESVTERDRLFAGCRLNRKEREELFDIFMGVAVWTRIYYSWRPNLRDESDNHLIELAVAGGAEAIVTRNVRDFVIGAELRFPRIIIATPAQYLRSKQ